MNYDEVIEKPSQVTIQTGVYAVYHVGFKSVERCLYVGASSNLKARMNSIFYSPNNIYLKIIINWFKENKPKYKLFVRIFKCEIEELEALELKYIDLLKPMTNCHHNKRFNKTARILNKTNLHP